MARDATLFTLMAGKTFFWIELIGLLLCFILVPGTVFFGDKIGLGRLQKILTGQAWEIQAVLVEIVTTMALGVALLHGTLAFEKRREKLLSEARAQREKAQQTRLENIRQRRKAELETKRKAETTELEAEKRRENAQELKIRA